jgi:Ca2+-transporting ATPase
MPQDAIEEAPLSARDAPLWWTLSGADSLRVLGVDEHGIGSDEALARRALHGPNELHEEQRTSQFAVFARQFQSPLIYILLAATVLTIVLQEWIDAGVIAFVLVLNAVIGFVQESRAERSAEALRKLSVTHARVLRDGHEREVDAAELVPGDVILLEAGSRVPADCRVLHCAAFEVDESLLTGESTTVSKHVEPLPTEAALADRANLVFMGSVVTRGRARCLVVATGTATQLGAIAGSVHGIARVETPIQRRIAQFARIVGVAVLAAGLLGLTAGLIAGEPLEELLLLIVALGVAAIPEGLPIVLTVTLAIGVSRMASRNVVVRRLAAVETLGSCTVIGSDKTGTLTQNRMVVQQIDVDGELFHVTGEGYELGGAITRDGRAVNLDQEAGLKLTLLAGALCNDAGLVESDGELDVHGDPTEIALLVSAARAGLYKDELEERYPRKAEIPFDSELRYAATVNECDGHDRLFVKGAPEAVLTMCESAQRGTLDERRVLDAAERMAGEGMRVLAMAYREQADAHVLDSLHQATRSLTFLGLQGMMDPPRQEAADAVRSCQAAGIRVLMITGDHATTALAIAQQLGIAGLRDRAVVGSDLDEMDDEQLGDVVRSTPVYARMSPQHKYRVVTQLQRQGEVVAVTGDGVNDAPALKAADIGAAMGRSGTDVAKEAADLVVADDNFASIFAAVEEGRIAFDNIRKATFFLIATGVGTVIAVLASVLFGFRLPFLPAQLLWLNLVTNGVQDVALAFEPGEKGIVRRPPRPTREGIISSLLWERTILVGIVLAVGTLTLFLIELEADSSTQKAQTVALTTMVLFQMFHVGNARSEYLSVFAKSPISNPFLFVGTAAALAIHLAAMYLPLTQYVLRIEPLDWTIWIRMIAVAFTVIIVVEVHKLVRGGLAAYTGRITDTP